jgi:hypothetical protein
MPDNSIIPIDYIAVKIDGLKDGVVDGLGKALEAM